MADHLKKQFGNVSGIESVGMRYHFGSNGEQLSSEPIAGMGAPGADAQANADLNNDPSLGM